MLNANFNSCGYFGLYWMDGRERRMKKERQRVTVEVLIEAEQSYFYPFGPTF